MEDTLLVFSLLRWKDKAVNMLYVFYCQQIQWVDPYQQHQSYHTNTYWVCIISLLYLLPLGAPLSSIKWLKTHQRATLLHRVTCSFITMSTHTSLFWFNAIYSTLSYCWQRYPMDMPLKIDPTNALTFAFVWVSFFSRLLRLLTVLWLKMYVFRGMQFLRGFKINLTQ